ncbi:MAG TPA: hypothetical protein VLH60_05480 [Sedimentisphaerales bacterium]|nr:hypothetical protein [Sedimentisphaerales bacterium]
MAASNAKTVAAAGIPLVLILCWVFFALSPVVSAQTPPNAADANVPAAQPRRPAMETVRTVSFRLRDGRDVSGRLVSDDRAQITVAAPVAGTLIATSYSRLDIEPRSISYQTLSEFQYWLNTGQYFEDRTWDFRNDAEEFAQALRCYQMARDMAMASMGAESPVARELELRINRLLESRQRWIEDIEPRARMAELEFKAELPARLDELSRNVAALQMQVEQFTRFAAELDATVADYQRNVDARLDRMADDIRSNYDYIRDMIHHRRPIIIPRAPTPQP